MCILIYYKHTDRIQLAKLENINKSSRLILNYLYFYILIFLLMANCRIL